MRVRTVNSTHFWTQLEGTDFSLGVVVPVSHAKDVLNTMQIPKGKSYQQLSGSNSSALILLVIIHHE